MPHRATTAERDWADTLAWQRSQLPDFIARLVDRSEFYADRLGGVAARDLATPEAWAALPFTTKDDVRDSQRHRRPEDPLLGALQGVADTDVAQVIGSSGTSGNPTFYGLTAADLASWQDALRNWLHTAGVGPGSVVALTTGMPIVAGGMPYADAIRAAGATLVWLGGQPTERMAHLMVALRVNTLIGTASFVGHFARRCSELLGRPAAELGVRTILAGGEPGMANEETRAQVMAAWGATRLSEIMGMCDVMAGMWAQCDAGAGMHFTAAEHVYVELIDPDTGEAVEWREGATGEGVYTTFTREATPVVRFRSRDHLEVVATQCACGRTTPRIQCIGRTDDMLIYRAMNVFPNDIREVILDHAPAASIGGMRIRKSRADQVRFDDPIPVEVETDTLDAAALERLADQVRQLLRVRVAIEAIPAGTIPVGNYKTALAYVAEGADT